MQEFKTESKKLLEMMIHSIYTNKEIFLRELISNASDAIDKMYVKSLEDKDIQFDKDRFFIELVPNREEWTLVIKDTGIGMDREGLAENLGTIAHSDSLAFKSAESNKDVANIIGQFGIGFYSAFMVAEKVEVLSRAYGSDRAYRWTSTGTEGFTIEEADKEETGTEVKLYLRSDEEEDRYSDFLEEYRLRSLVTKYSNYIRYPILMEVTKTRKLDKGEEGKDEPEYEEYKERETLNSMTPIWSKPRTELTDEDYKQFYRQESFGFDEPLSWIHMVADGTISYRAILYIPGSAPYDYYSKDYKKGLALYSQGVKIMDHCEDLLPDHFSFVKGVVSTEDLSLNVSRETLQQNRQLIAIARKIESRITEELKKMLKNEPDKYKQFFDLFGVQIKGGIYQSFGAKKDQLADLLVFHSSKNAGLRTLEDVLNGYGYPSVTAEGDDGAKEADKSGQKIFYATGDSVERVDRLPALQGLKVKGTEVLYLVDDIDEFAIKMMQDYQGHPFQSVLSGDFNPDEDQAEEAAEGHEDLLKKMQEVLEGEVIEVKSSKRLDRDAVALVAKGDISIDMEKTFMNQPDSQYMKAEKVLEINLKHPIVSKLEGLSADGEEFAKITRILYNQARLIEGLPIDDPVGFARDMQEFMA